MAASMPAATCGPAGRGCASWLSTRKARASCPTFLVAERQKAKVLWRSAGADWRHRAAGW